MAQAQQDVLWKPDAGIPQDDLAKRPSMRFRLCDLCRSILTSPEVLQTSCERLSGITLCGGTLKETQCSLRAMVLHYFLNFHIMIGEENPHDWLDYEHMKGVLTHRLSPQGQDRKILNIYPGPSHEVDWASSPWLRFHVQAYPGKDCGLLREI